jgi:hypothetical protein
MSTTSSLFVMSRDNPLLSFVVRGVPTIAETRIDSKKVRNVLWMLRVRHRDFAA